MQSLDESLAAIFTLAGAESVREVRVAGQPVHRAGEPMPGPQLADDGGRDPGRAERRRAGTRFVAALGWVFEDSPWVAERAWERRPFASMDALHGAMVEALSAAGADEQLALLRAHPDLGARARMSDASVGEQAGAGLDRLTPAEFERLQQLNHDYREAFGFPFLFAVKGATKHDVLAALERRRHVDARRGVRRGAAPGRAHRALPAGEPAAQLPGARRA